MKRISIIVPVYNVEAYLKECIDSIIRQMYKNIEILLIDDGSTDSSGIICDNYAKYYNNVKVIHKKNGGLSSARNAGIDIASGEYIAFVDSDDMIDCSMYQILGDIMEKNPETDIVSCGIMQFYDGNYVKTKSFLKKHNAVFTAEEYIRLVLKHEIDNAVCNKLYRKEVIGNIRFKDGQINEDVLFNIEVLKKVNHITYISNELYRYRLRKGSITQQANPKLFDFIDNAFSIKEIILKEMSLPLKVEMEGYIYHEITNYIATVERHKSAHLYRKQMQTCKEYVLQHCFAAISNTSWPITYKVKYILVTCFPQFYRFLLRL